MIPTTIRREHVLKAAEWIDHHGDDGRPSRKYVVIINGRPYPPKLVISKAYFYAHGSEWSHSNFHGGEETNSYLKGLGFEIRDIGSPFFKGRGDQRRPLGQRATKPPSTSELDRVRQIARSMDIRVTSVESDTGNRDTDSILLLHMGNGHTKDVHIISDSEGEDDVLYVSMNIEFNPPVSGYVSDRPEEEYSEFMTGLMRGRTQFELELDGRILKSVDLRQIVPVSAGDDTLKRVLLAAVVEILETETNVRTAIGDAHSPERQSMGRRDTSSSRDSMYA